MRAYLGAPCGRGRNCMNYCSAQILVLNYWLCQFINYEMYVTHFL